MKHAESSPCTPKTWCNVFVWSSGPSFGSVRFPFLCTCPLPRNWPITIHLHCNTFTVVSAGLVAWTVLLYVPCIETL